jgi:hypothetical protein
LAQFGIIVHHGCTIGKSPLRSLCVFFAMVWYAENRGKRGATVGKVPEGAREHPY